MTWWLVLYMVAGVALTLFICWLEDRDLSSFDIQLAIFAGPFIGVPCFIFVMLFFFNWGLAIRRGAELVATGWRSWKNRGNEPTNGNPLG